MCWLNTLNTIALMSNFKILPCTTACTNCCDLLQILCCGIHHGIAFHCLTQARSKRTIRAIAWALLVANNANLRLFFDGSWAVTWCEIVSDDANLTISKFFNDGKNDITETVHCGWLLPILHAVPFMKNCRIGDANFQEVVKNCFPVLFGLAQYPMIAYQLVGFIHSSHKLIVVLYSYRKGNICSLVSTSGSLSSSTDHSLTVSRVLVWHDAIIVPPADVYIILATDVVASPSRYICTTFAESFRFWPTFRYQVQPCSVNGKLYKNSRSSA